MITKISGLSKNRVLFDEIEIGASMNILFGGNGVGKSSFIEAILKNRVEVEYSEDVNPIIMYYKNSEHNVKINKTRELSTFNEFLKAMHSNNYSEGQASIHHILSFLEDVKDRLKETDDNIVVLLDEVDSGLSVENINMLMWIIKDIMDSERVNMFIATNHYHWVYVYKHVIDMYTGKYTKIESYEDYLDRLNNGIQIMNQSGKREFNFLDVY